MILGIMQPYFMPYIGYWQLMNAVDEYVIYDDVTYIKQGWINRNRILVNGEIKYFNLPLIGSSSNKLINEIMVNNDSRVIDKNMRKIENAYKKAPYYKKASELLEQIMRSGKENVASYIKYSFEIICEYLCIDTKIMLSSDLEKDNTLQGQDKIISICHLLNATEYYNAVGGKELYSYETFQEHGIKLSFLKTDTIIYQQFGQDFVPNLSLIDVLMFNSADEIKQMLGRYSLINS